MATEELVTEQFKFLGIEVPENALPKCVTICDKYNIDAETFVELWMAFSLSHLNGASPNLDNLDLLERKEISKRTADRGAPVKDIEQATGAGLTIYGTTTGEKPENEVLSNYVATTPKRVKREVDSKAELGPATYSPTVVHSVKYASRSNAGAVLHSFGDESLLERLSQPTSPTDVLDVNVSLVPNDDGDVYTKAMFGFELLHEKAGIVDNHISYLAQCIMKKAGIAQCVSVRHKTQTEVYVAGRIECDADARLNPKCVVLQGAWTDSLSQAVPVDLDNVKQYSLFPGQVVVMRGVNVRGDRFTAHEIYSDATLPVPDFRTDIMTALNGTLTMLIAAGPYTTSDNLSYEPLKDLVAHIAAQKPHVAILTGPFLDADHAKVSDNTMAETYKAFFDKLVDSFSELNTTSPFTKIYVVASHKDAFHVNVFPTPPYASRRRAPAASFVSDPAVLSVNGLSIAATSIDALMNISHEEISMGCGGDKLSRLSSHVLQQQSVACAGGGAGGAGGVGGAGGAAGDAALWAAHAQLAHTPHVLVLPSSFRYFVKEVNGCVVVNPEHLTKGLGGGTFARLALSATQDSALKVAAQILRI